MRIKLLKKIYLLLFFLFFFFSCFEYSDSIVLNDNLSGIISIKYTVPLYYKNKKYKSYIGRYPYSEKKIREYFSSEGLLVKNVNREIEAGSENAFPQNDKALSPETKKLIRKIKYFGKVKFNIAFTNIRDLEKVIPGKFSILRLTNGIRFSREIKGGRPKKNYVQNIKRKIYQLSKSFMAKQNLVFSLSWPDNLISSNNNCTFLTEHLCTWKIPIKNSLSDFSKKNLFLVLKKKTNSEEKK